MVVHNIITGFIAMFMIAVLVGVIDFESFLIIAVLGVFAFPTLDISSSFHPWA